MVVRTLQTIGRPPRKIEAPVQRGGAFKSFGMCVGVENYEILVCLVGPRRDGYHNRRVVVRSPSGLSKIVPRGGISPIMGVPPGCIGTRSIVESPAWPRLFAEEAKSPRPRRLFDLASVGRMIA